MATSHLANDRPQEITVPPTLIHDADPVLARTDPGVPSPAVGNDGGGGP